MADPSHMPPGTSEASTPQPFVLLSKIRVPALAPHHVTRTHLLDRIDAGTSGRLTLVAAPAGFGKTQLLAGWCRSDKQRTPIAWLSLDEHDNDLVTLWTYIVHALDAAYPGRFARSLSAVAQADARLRETLLPILLAELGSSDGCTVLVLDDFHALTDTICLNAFRDFLTRLPAACHLLLAARGDPALSLGRLRVAGELLELRASDLRFTNEETRGLINDAVQTDLPAHGVEQLAARTEGWPAGVYLAALCLRDHPDPEAFIARFSGEHRYLVDYFGSEVLEQLTEADRDFLVQASVLDQLTGPLCDALLRTGDASARLRSLAERNVFVFPGDDTWQTYRCHALFRELLQAALRRRYPERVAGLHRRAAAWYREAGDAPAAMKHAQAAGDVQLMGDLFLACAGRPAQQGLLATLTAWLASLPEAALVARPALALHGAWVAALTGQPPAAMGRFIGLAAAGTDDGPFFLQEPSLATAVALQRAYWAVDDVGTAVSDAEAAVAGIMDRETPAYLVSRAALGQALYLAGRPAEARAALEEALRAPLAHRQARALIQVLALLALTSLALEEEARAGELAQRAVAMLEERGMTAAPTLRLSYVALGGVLVQQGRLDEAAAVLARGVEPELERLTAWPLQHALALVALVTLDQARGEDALARMRLEELRAAVRGCPNAGMLPGLLAELERAQQRLARRAVDLREPLTEGELRVLRLLVSNLSQREIGQELNVSLNTVKAHLRAIYGKLGVACRADAVARARALGLIR
jgi:LuxR family maltose regulon positive regulatory protein